MGIGVGVGEVVGMGESGGVGVVDGMPRPGEGDTLSTKSPAWLVSSPAG